MLKNHELTGKCCLCDRRVYSRYSCYCLRCYHFVRAMDQRGLHRDAVERIKKHVRKNGFVCEYTGIQLNMTNPKSAWYFVFDHQIPGDERTVVLTFALLNEMKSDLTFKEFRRMIRQFYGCFFLGRQFTKSRLRYWLRLRPPPYFLEKIAKAMARFEA